MNQGARTVLNGVHAPDRNDEYFIYQTLAGTWSPAVRPGLATFTERIVHCVLKSVRESKQHTSWTDPNTAYEEAVKEFVRRILSADLADRFLPDLEEFLSPVAFHGGLNSPRPNAAQNYFTRRAGHLPGQRTLGF
jgi:(1->4)-alpha-D-glucan 1-alpha-D-glucosylmutase